MSKTKTGKSPNPRLNGSPDLLSDAIRSVVEEAMEATYTRVKSDIQGVGRRIDGLSGDVKKVDKSLIALDKRVGILDGRVGALDKRVGALSDKLNKRIEARVDYAVNQHDLAGLPQKVTSMSKKIDNLATKLRR